MMTSKLLIFAILMMLLAASVFANRPGPRTTYYIGSTIYGGRQYDTFVSCGSSAGDFAYTCAEGGGCYENTSVDASQYCGG
jgi:threonine/homoserine/homoserine lactone efflux protein